MKYIIHLTTTAKRINYIDKTLKSLLSQEIQPDKIILSIDNATQKADKNKYDDKIYLNILDKDYGPVQKLVGFLFFMDKNPEYKDHAIMICDDDAEYDSKLSSLYAEEIKNRPNECLTTFGKQIRIPGMVHIQGSDSYIIPSIINQNTNLETCLKYIAKVFKECPSAFYQDDYVICYFLNKVCNIRTDSIYKNRIYYKISHQIDQLHHSSQVHKVEADTIIYFIKLSQAQFCHS